MNRRAALRALFATTATVTLAACQGYSAPSPFGRRGGDGKPLSLAVQRAFREDPETLGIQIEVYSTDENVVILKGTVGTDAQRNGAERVATAVAEVRRVDNALWVR